MDVAYARELLARARPPAALPDAARSSCARAPRDVREARSRAVNDRRRRPRLLGAEPPAQPRRARRRRGRRRLRPRRETRSRTIGRRYPAVKRADDARGGPRRPTRSRPSLSHARGDPLRARGARRSRAGKHVFVEKPLAAPRARRVELVATAASVRLVLMPGHTFLYSPPVTLSRELIDAGELGDIYFITTSRVNLGLHQSDVSVVWDLAPHDFSILRYWLGEMPTQCRRASRSCVHRTPPDVAFIDLEYASGRSPTWSSPGSPRASCAAPRSSARRRCSSTTTRATSRCASSTPARTLPDPETFGEFSLTYRTGDIVSPRSTATEPLALELGDFCQSDPDGRRRRARRARSGSRSSG